MSRPKQRSLSRVLEVQITLSLVVKPNQTLKKQIGHLMFILFLDQDLTENHHFTVSGKAW